jgi:hypothetical protein
MVPENKQNRRYKQINVIGIQNNRHPSQNTVGNVHKAPAPAGARSGEIRRTFCRRDGNPRTCDSGSAIDS